MKHKNITKRREIVTNKQEVVEFRKDKDSLYPVFEFMEHDLMEPSIPAFYSATKSLHHPADHGGIFILDAFFRSKLIF